jgi:hypothetical protein
MMNGEVSDDRKVTRCIHQTWKRSWEWQPGEVVRDNKGRKNTISGLCRQHSAASEEPAGVKRNDAKNEELPTTKRTNVKFRKVESINIQNREKSKEKRRMKMVELKR